MGRAKVTLVNIGINVIEEWKGSTPLFGITLPKRKELTMIGNIGMAGTFDIEFQGGRLETNIFMAYPIIQSTARRYVLDSVTGSFPLTIRDKDNMTLFFRFDKDGENYRMYETVHGTLMNFPPVMYEVTYR